MATNKKSKASESGASMDMVWQWLYAIGLVVAGIAGAFAFQNQILSIVLVLISFLCGLFYFHHEMLGDFGLRVVALYFAQAGLGVLPVVGPYFNGFFGGWVFFLLPAVLGLALRFVWEKRLAPLFMR